MTVEVPMPQMGESIAEGTLVKWHKAVGDRVKRDETLFEISTDKVDTEVPSPQNGYLVKVLVREGETVPVHTIVCVLGDAAPSDLEPLERSPGEGGTGKTDAGTARVAGPGAATNAGAVAAEVAGATTGAAATTTAAALDRGRESRLREKSSPLVRRLAAEHGIELGQLTGSGVEGRVTRDDMLRILAEREARGPIKPSAAEAAREDRVEPLSVMRQRIAEHMVLSRRTSAHVSSIFEVDMTLIRALKSSLARQYEEKHQVKLTYMPFILHAVAQALTKFPVLNASIDGKNVHYHGAVNIGVAVALEEGLIVPVVHDADRKDLAALARSVSDLAKRARAKQLKPDEVQGGTFTVTNPGVFGSLMGTPIINQPQVGILCVGAITKRAVVLPDTDAIAVRSMAFFSLTFDHRLVDGSVADRFLAEVKSELEGVGED